MYLASIKILDTKTNSFYNRNVGEKGFYIKTSLKVALVVNLKLAFTEWGFYNLVILIKLCKLQYLIWIPKFRQSSIISKKPGYLSEKLKTLTSSNYHEV